MRERVEAILAKLRPGLGGTDVVLVDVGEGIVKVKVLPSPGCSGPSMPEEMVLEELEEQLKEEVPEIKEVIAV
jgi:Fe-S cluster biogenesis protein NfuA